MSEGRCSILMTTGRFLPVHHGLGAGKGPCFMLAALTIIAVLLGGTVSPKDGLPGGPSITTNATTTAPSPIVVDDGLPGGPS